MDERLTLTLPIVSGATGYITYRNGYPSRAVETRTSRYVRPSPSN